MHEHDPMSPNFAIFLTLCNSTYQSLSTLAPIIPGQVLIHTVSIDTTTDGQCFQPCLAYLGPGLCTVH